MRRYLEQNGIVLKELLPGGRARGPARHRAERHAVKNILTITPTGQKDFTKRLARAGIHLYPQCGRHLSLCRHSDSGLCQPGQNARRREVLVDFGELYGDAVKAIRQSGLHVVQIAPDEPYTTIAAKMLDGLGALYRTPLVSCRAAPAPYNTTVTIQGVLMGDTESDKRTLLAALGAAPGHHRPAQRQRRCRGDMVKKDNDS
jgi:hypothetical protein